MKLIVVGIVATIALGEVPHPINDELVASIKSKATTWVPYETNENPLRHLSHDEIKSLLGTEVDILSPARRQYKKVEVNADVPESFDSRT